MWDVLLFGGVDDTESRGAATGLSKADALEVLSSVERFDARVTRAVARARRGDREVAWKRLPECRAVAS